MSGSSTKRRYNADNELIFLSKALRMSSKDRKDVNILIMLCQVEHHHLLKGNGITWYRHLKNNYGFQVHSNLDLQIENILVSTNETYETFLERNKG